jgi:hypothetical protein
VIREALTDLFEPEQDALRLPADAVAETLMSMGVSTGRAGDRVGQAEPADLFPRGALTAGGDR